MARRKGAQHARGPYLLSAELIRERVESFERYPFALPAIRNLERLEFHPRVTFFIGENGAGKSTLLEALAVAVGLNAEGGSRNFNFTTRASHSDLDGCLRIANGALAHDSYFLRAESFYNVATEVERLGVAGGYGARGLHEQSHGESFIALFENRFRGNGLYFLDEPEAALSPKRQLQFLATLHAYGRRGGQFLIATHSPIIMAYPHARLYLFDQTGIRRVAYEETDHYLVTRGFLANPQRTLKELLRDDADPEADDVDGADV